MSDVKNRVSSGDDTEKPDASDDTVTKAAERAQRMAQCRFSGSYVHGVDSKGRLIIPAGFREALGDHFVVALTPDFQNIAIYPEEEWLNQQERLEKLSEFDARVMRLIEQFNKYSYMDSETDQQGRLLLPQKLRSKFLDNCREVEISGAKRYIRVLKSESGAEEDAAFREEFPDPLSFLAEVQRSAHI